MAVYTQISVEEVSAFLAAYDLGALKSFEGIVKGVTNSNFHLFTDRGRYILTIFEGRRVREQDLPFFFAYADHLAAKGIICPAAILDRSGKNIGRLCGKAACILNFLPGADVEVADLTPGHCGQVGTLLARMHMAAADFSPRRENSMGISVWPKLAEKVLPHADQFEKGLAEIVAAELDYLQQNWPADLPIGAVHADVFPDNVFFEKGRLSAVIDFYFSCSDFCAFDLAVTINAWCFDSASRFVPGRFQTMMKAYEAVRPLSEAERAALQVLCRGTAFRTLVSRLEEYFEHDPDTLMTPHDPKAYLMRLQFHQHRDVCDVF